MMYFDIAQHDLEPQVQSEFFSVSTSRQACRMFFYKGIDRGGGGEGGGKIQMLVLKSVKPPKIFYLYHRNFTGATILMPLAM